MNIIKEKVSVADCMALIESDKPLQFIKQSLYSLLANPDNFETFCRFLFPTAFSKPFADFHTEIFNKFNHIGDSVVAAPRGHGKSTLVGLGYVLWLLAYQKENYIVYTSQNHEKSVQFLEPIKFEIQSNKLFKFVYGEFDASIVKDDEDVLGKRDREDCFDYRGIRVQALSFEKNIRGLKFGSARPSLIVLDDVDDDQRCLNPDLRRKDSDKLNKQIVPSVDAETGKIKMIGTILHHDSLLARQLRTHNGKIYKAIREDGTPLFPALYSLEKLAERKRIMGSSSFESEYMNNPVDDENAIINPEWVNAAFDETLSFFEPLKHYDLKYQGIDFAFSDRTTADKSVFLGLGLIGDRYEIFQCIMKKGLTITQQFQFINMLQGTVQYDDNALEENSIRSMSNELLTYDFPFTLFWTAAADAAKKEKYDREFTGKRHTVGKLPMINRLATQFENGRIKIPYKTEEDKRIAHLIKDELVTFSRVDGKIQETGVHSDVGMALGFAVERAEMDKFNFDYGSVEMNGGELL